MQIHITAIENGWLVMTPQKAPTIRHPNSPQEQPQPLTHFSGSMDDVCDYLKSLGLEQ